MENRTYCEKEHGDVQSDEVIFGKLFFKEYRLIYFFYLSIAIAIIKAYMQINSFLSKDNKNYSYKNCEEKIILEKKKVNFVILKYINYLQN